MTLDEKIEQARRHVENGRRAIERQRAIVARFGSPLAVDLLASFERSQAIFEADLNDLLNKR